MGRDLEHGWVAPMAVVTIHTGLEVYVFGKAGQGDVQMDLVVRPDLRLAVAKGTTVVFRRQP